MRYEWRRVSRRKKAVIVVLAVAIALPAYARFIEPQRIQVTRYDVKVAGLPKSLDGTTVVQISDLHRSIIVRDSLIEKAVRLANAESPDIVALTGDFVSRNAKNAGPCADMMTALDPRLGTYAVLGNHDYWTDAATVSHNLRARGIKVLTNTNVEVAPGLYLIGIDDQWAGHPDARRAWRGVDESKAQVVLAHSPISAKLFRGHRCLALTGHTHGGEICIPFVPRSALPGLLGCPYISGWYNVGKARMYVNRGIGAVNPTLMRFRCPPEVTVFRLRAGRSCSGSTGGIMPWISVTIKNAGCVALLPTRHHFWVARCELVERLMPILGRQFLIRDVDVSRQTQMAGM